MAFQNAEAIQKLYVAFFNRPADYYGLQYWDSVVTAAKGDTTAVAAEFSKSKEYTDTFAGMNTRQVINTVYKNLFGRSADEAGLEYWFAEVQAGRVTIANAVTSIAAGAQNADKIAYASKVTAATAFTDALNTTDERLGYAGEKANAIAKQFIAGVTDAATLATAITPANLDATVNTSIGAGAVATTYQLTKGLDNIPGTNGNDIIVGSIDSSDAGVELNTLSSIDLVNGGAGVDTLKIAHAESKDGVIALGSLSNVEVVEITSAYVNTAVGGLGVDVNTTSATGVTDLNIVRAADAVKATAGATTNVGVSMKDVAGVGSITVIGGKNVNVANTDSVSAINVGAGADADPSGAVTISATGAAAVNNTNVNMGKITVGGGTTVSVTQKASVNAAGIVADGVGETVVQGNVEIVAAATTTDVTVKQDATQSARSRAAVTGVDEVVTVKFTELKATESVTVGGLTFTAAKDLTAAQVAQAFANLSATALTPTQIGGPAANGDTNGSSVASNGVFTGSLTSRVLDVDGVTPIIGGSWSSGAANGDTVTFTGMEGTAQVNLTASAKATATTTTDGIDAVSLSSRLGITAGTVTIDGGAALKNVTVDGFSSSTGAAGINGATNTALSTITLANGGDFGIDSAAAGLTLNATAINGTVNVAKGAKTIDATVTNNSTFITTLASASAETLNVKGAAYVAGSTDTGGLTAATAINTSGMTGGIAAFTIADGTATTFTGGAASDRVVINNAGTAVTKAVSLGAGNDRLTLSGDVKVPTATLSGGEGTDQIRINGASAAALSQNGDFAGKIDGFERLVITDTVSTTTSVNMSNMDGITYVISNNSTASGTAAVAEQQSFVLNLAEQQTMVITNGSDAAVAEEQSFTVTGTASAAGKVTVMGVDVAVADTTNAAGVATAIAAAKAAIIAANPTVADITATGADVTIVYTTAAGDVANATVTAAATGITVGALAEDTKGDTNAGNITVAGTTIALTAGMSIDDVGTAIAAKAADIKTANANVDAVTYDVATNTLRVTYKASAGDVATAFAAADTGNVGFTANAVASQYGIVNGNITIAGATVATSNGQTVDQLGALIAASEGAIKTATPTVDTVTYDAATNTVLVTYTTGAANVATNAAVVAGTTGIAGGSFTETRAYAGTSAGTPSLTIDKMVNDSTLELVKDGSGVIVKMADATGTADSFNIVTTVSTANLDFGNVIVAGVETIKVNASDNTPTDSSGNPTIDTATLDLSADKATSVTINGNSNIDLMLTSTTKSVATVDASALTGDLSFIANAAGAANVVAVTVTGGSGDDVLRASVATNATADVLNGGAGEDMLFAGTNGAKLTGGEGNDIFVVTGTFAGGTAFVGNKEGNTYSEITDFKAGDLLQLQAFTGGTLNTTLNVFTGSTAADVSNLGKLTATLNEATATFSNFVDAAVKQANAGAAVWFNYKNDLYVVVDNHDNSDAFQNGADTIVKLTGINGDSLTWNSDFGTAALI